MYNVCAETYHGKPCVHCGGTEKYRASRTCVVCAKRKRKERDSANPKEKRKYNSLYYQNNKDAVKKTTSLYRERNLEKMLLWCSEYHKKYIKTEKGKVKRSAIYKRHNSLKKGATLSDLTSNEWESIKRAFGFRCAYCGKKPETLEQDHITPLSKGGNHTVSNVVPCCRSCNSKKHTKGPLCIVQPLLLAV